MISRNEMQRSNDQAYFLSLGKLILSGGKVEVGEWYDFRAVRDYRFYRNLDSELSVRGLIPLQE